MNAATRRRLWVLAAATVAVAAPAWLLAPPSIEIPPVAPMIATRLEIEPVGGLDMALVAPPFAPTRSPPSDEAPDASAVATTAEAPVATPRPTLVGIVTTPGHGVVLLKNAAGETEAVKLGGRFGDWTVSVIAADRAVVARGGERETLTLDYRNKTDAVPAAAQSSPPASADSPR